MSLRRGLCDPSRGQEADTHNYIPRHERPRWVEQVLRCVAVQILERMDKAKIRQSRGHETPCGSYQEFALDQRHRCRSKDHRREDESFAQGESAFDPVVETVELFGQSF